MQAASASVLICPTLSDAPFELLLCQLAEQCSVQLASAQPIHSPLTYEGYCHGSQSWHPQRNLDVVCLVETKGEKSLQC